MNRVQEKSLDLDLLSHLNLQKMLTLKTLIAIIVVLTIPMTFLTIEKSITLLKRSVQT